MRIPFVVILGASLSFLGACGTTPDEQAPAAVEERQPGSGSAGGATAQPLDRKPIASVDLTQGGKGAASMLKDPNNILSKRSIYYEYDKFDIGDEYRSLIDAHAKYLRDNPSARMLIQGNADDRGSREYNLGLGQRRSDSVKKMLMLLGVKETQIESVSLGEEKPQAEGQREAAWAKNRRSDILYAGEY